MASLEEGRINPWDEKFYQLPDNSGVMHVIVFGFCIWCIVAANLESRGGGE
jgi:hypothetical protein